MLKIKVELGLAHLCKTALCQATRTLIKPGGVSVKRATHLLTLSGSAATIVSALCDGLRHALLLSQLGCGDAGHSLGSSCQPLELLFESSN